jgi:hypothetical protein
MNLRHTVQSDTRKIIGQRLFLAVVDSTNGGLVKIRRVGQASADGQFYPAATGLAATLSGGEKVLCVAVGGTVIVLLEITTS